MTFLNNANSLCLVTLSSPSPSADPAKLHSKLEALKKVEELCDFHENLKTSKDEPKKFLENLCDGLETFLGFNSASKGYTGEGIVYSDLDRLCDAVMGFLSGVLGAVKDDENVKHYYDFSSCINAVNENMHKGSGEFISTINTVSDALADWNSKVNEKTENVKNAFKNLENVNFVSLKNSLNALSGLDEHNLSQVDHKLQVCIDSAALLDEAFGAAEKAYRLLDPALKNRLKDSVTSVKTNVKTFLAAASNTELKQLLKEGEKQLGELEQRVKYNVRERIALMQDNINTEFSIQFLIPIGDVNDKLKVVYSDLQMWIAEAEKVVKKAIEKCEQILGRVKDGHSLNPKNNSGNTEITKQVTDLRDKAIQLRDAAIAARDAVQAQVDEALTQAVKLDKSVKYSVGRVKEEIQTAISKYVTDYVTKVKENLKQIKGGDPQNTEGLEDIVNAVKKWSNMLSNPGGFRQMLKQWVDEILETDEIVIGKVKAYITGNGKLRTEYHNVMLGEDNYLKLINIISEQIVSKLNSDAVLSESAAAVRFDEGAATEIEKHVTAVQTGCMMFAATLGNKLTKGTFGTYADTIAGEIELLVAQGGKSGNRPSLKLAIQFTLHLLVGMARLMVSNLEWLIGENDEEGRITNVSKALKVAGELELGLLEALKSTTDLGDRYNTAPYFDPDSPGSGIVQLKHNIVKTINGVLVKDIGVADEGGDWGKFALSSKNFSEYLGIITVPASAKLTGIKYGDEGSLPQAIGEIYRDVTNKLNSNGVKNILDKTDNIFTSAYDQIQTQLMELTKLVDGREGADYLFKDENPNQKGVKVLLEELMIMLGESTYKVLYTSTKGLSGIQLRINRILMSDSVISNTLQTILTKAEQFYSTVIKPQADDAVSDIKSFLTEQINHQFKAIRQFAKTQYHTKINEMFNKVQLGVTARIAEIHGIIADDLRIGTKSLLKHVQGRIDTAGAARTDKLDALLYAVSSAKYGSEKFRDLSKALLNYLFPTLEFIKSEVMTRIPGHEARKNKTSEMVSEMRNGLDDLLRHLQKNYTRYSNFDNTFSDQLHTLQNTLTTFDPSALDPQALPDAGRPVLKALQKGMLGFVRELGKAYISKYDGGEGIKDWVTKGEKGELTPEGKNGAKVFLTILGILLNDLMSLSETCKQAQFKPIHSAYNKYNSIIADFFSSHGYKVPKLRASRESELSNKAECTGTDIYRKINDKKFSIFQLEHLQQWLTEKNKEWDIATSDVTKMSLLDILHFLYDCLENYYSVSHLRHIERPKSPSSVYDMLRWLTGLPHNTVFAKVSVGDIGQLFEKPEEEKNDDTVGISVVDDDEQLPAYPAPVTAANIRGALQNVCVDAEDVLTSILGHGHADGIYAVDFNTNPDGFSYPAAPGACFDMLVDILKRLYDQLFFLFIQCQRTYEANSWRDCWYGRGIAGSSWTCNEKQCANQNCPQLANQNGNQKADQRCDQHPNCGLKSPLQSFLEDGLQGFLPHSFTKPGCKLTCTVTKHRGLPCKTPMGFKDISVTASHTRRGEHLMRALEGFCGESYSPLTKLCGYLNCLLQQPPQNLGDMFSFYYNFLVNWSGNAKGNIDVNKHKMTGFKDAVTRANFGVPYPELNVDSIITDHNTNNHTTGDLLCLYSCNSTSSLTANCGRYLQPFGMNTWTTFSEKHADKYLSWIVYLTETFYDLLYQLYKECCNNCDKAGSRCYGKVCSEKCQVKYTTDGSVSKPQTPTYHNTNCKSIGYCPSTRPTLCKYGFVFKSLSNMSGTSGEKTKRTCKDLCHALQNVLLKGKVLGDFTHVTIPEFLFKIRFPFMTLTLALWLLSLFYLLHIMVIRLDLLHIKSHLHSPSSHRIAAQSLLAAGRVNKLNRVFYLQP